MLCLCVTRILHGAKRQTSWNGPFYYCYIHKIKTGKTLSFKIYHTCAVRHEDYLSPNEYNWVTNEETVCRNENDVCSLFIEVDRNNFLKRWDNIYDEEVENVIVHMLLKL